MSEREPRRLVDEGGALGDLLAAGKSDLPDERQLLLLAAKVGAATGTAVGSTAVGGKVASGAFATKGGLGIKILLVTAIGGGIAGGAVLVERRAPRQEPARLVATVAAVPQVASIPVPSGLAIAEPAIVPTAKASSVPRAPSASRWGSPSTSSSSEPTETGFDAEMKLIERAQASLRSEPSEALSLANEHARRFPNGVLAQEREVVAIEALVKTGRGGEGRARAAAFKATYPGSSHTRRIDILVDR